MDSFELLVQEQGEWAIWEKLRKLTSFRKYYQRWPYDDVAPSITDMGHLGDYVDSTAVDPYEYHIAEDGFEGWLKSLPSKQEVVARMTLQGYKPREMPFKSARWHKHELKKRIKNEGVTA